MFAEWVTQGVAAGVQIMFTIGTIFVIAGIAFGVLALIIKLIDGDDNEKKNC